MDEPELFDALRRLGVDADDPHVRSGVRLLRAHLDEVLERHGTHTARRVMVAMRAAIEHQMDHPDVTDMSSFELAMDEEE